MLFYICLSSWLKQNSINVWQCFFLDPFILVYWHNKYKTQRMCDKAINDCLTKLKFIPDGFVTSKIL